MNKIVLKFKEMLILLLIIRLWENKNNNLIEYRESQCSIIDIEITVLFRGY